MTPLIAGGWIATNLATALISLLGVYLFARIAKHHQLPHSGLLTVGFAFTPLLFINSISTMDYMWTLTAILASYDAVQRRHPVWAGLFLGLAIAVALVIRKRYSNVMEGMEEFEDDYLEDEDDDDEYEK